MHHGRNGHQQLHRDGRGRGDQLLRRRFDRGMCRRQRGQSDRRLPCRRLRERQRQHGRLHRLCLCASRDLELRGARRCALRRQLLRRLHRAARPRRCDNRRLLVLRRRVGHGRRHWLVHRPPREGNECQLRGFGLRQRAASVLREQPCHHGRQAHAGGNQGALRWLA